MTWHLIPIPAPEELAFGYTPTPHVEASEAEPSHQTEASDLRRYLLTVFVVFGLLVGFQSLFADKPTEGQRRVAEINLSERKAQCQGCEPAAAWPVEPKL